MRNVTDKDKETYDAIAFGCITAAECASMTKTRAEVVRVRLKKLVEMGYLTLKDNKSLSVNGKYVASKLFYVTDKECKVTSKPRKPAEPKAQVYERTPMEEFLGRAA